MNQEIKRCPYCNAVGRLSYVKLSGLYVVECSHCLNKGFHAPTQRQAIDSWNERAEIRRSKSW